MPTAVKVDDSRVVVSLGRFRLSLEQNDELMQQIGASQLLSIRRTFRDQGSPAGSWQPLAPSTIARDPKHYGPGHKLLIGSGRLLNSINVSTVPGRVILGSNLVYARVHQYGSRDRQAFGPRTEEQENATVNVAAHRRLLSNYIGRRMVLSRNPSAALEGPLEEGKKNRKRVRLEGPRAAHYESVFAFGPRNESTVTAHSRHQNIPARPYLVFRPEDPGRIRGVVVRYVNEAEKKAGLAGGQ